MRIVVVVVAAAGTSGSGCDVGGVWCNERAFKKANQRSRHTIYNVEVSCSSDDVCNTLTVQFTSFDVDTTSLNNNCKDFTISISNIHHKLTTTTNRNIFSSEGVRDKDILTTPQPKPLINCNILLPLSIKCWTKERLEITLKIGSTMLIN
ncbi:hypothetical protein PPL_08323 [Heterostelium album PN500]|uniref:Secreted protein n=1 Tax=Heterostelium pallidum (strain ATCC 26659 / Pp 5 / PN500) TaxID=670386 RepID=D3BHV5_HETP5|nr:hypothetical protein PPL_08323 [Heterostelium album PN500]EFA78855.1 hypothetical protein PPL_08323 [Heterostelium album PN500]|eukprot:XP_020430979.1 hypothetical protein PPL_08323 [Heterostelium album PN500]